MARPFAAPVDVPSPSAADQDRVDRVARAILARQPKLSDISAFGDKVCAGVGGTAVILGDNGEIPLMSDIPRERLDYRLGYLAEAGDIVVIGGRSCPAFEQYQKKLLGISDLTYMNVDPNEALPPRATPAICLKDDPVFRTLIRHLENSGSPTIFAHLTTGTIWALASRIASQLDRRVFVAGPPPRVSRFVNDKIWFGATAADLLGKQSIPPKRCAHGFAALTRHVAALAAKWESLFIKVPDSAGSAGNYALLTRGLRGLGAKDLHAFLRDFLAHAGWPERFPLLVEVMDANVLSSPSAQTWIPSRDEGPPILEGIFEQMISGVEGAFVGAVQAAFPDELSAKISHQALHLATLLQKLGYYGRCSFDAVLSGRRLNTARLHWIECNGRWGGVSIPMSLMNRLHAPCAPPPYVIVQDGVHANAPLPFDKCLSRLARADAPPGEVLILSPNSIEQGQGAHFLAHGATRADALALSRWVIRQLG